MNLIETFYRIFGYRKESLLGDSNSLEKSLTYKKVRTRKERTNEYIDLSGSHEICQGRIGACGCATLAGICQDEIVKITKDKNIEVNWKKAWQEMKTLGIADDSKGSYLSDNLWYGVNVGFEDNRGLRWKITAIEKISRIEIEHYVRMGYQIYTGSRICRPMCDRFWTFKTLGVKIGGHAFRIIGKSVRRLLAETTWKNFGYKKESQFFINPDDTNRLFTCYVMNWKSSE